MHPETYAKVPTYDDVAGHKPHVDESTLRQIARFLFVGLSAATIEFGSFLLLYYVANGSLILANGASFLLGLITSFGLNRQWTFFTKGERFDKRMHHQFVLYCVLAAINLGLTLLLVEAFGLFGIVPAVAKFLAMGITSVWNFVFYRLIIFSAGTK
jgi:putative flippase GtrA